MNSEATIAAIDLGTNCARLAIGIARPESPFRKLVHRRVITRLGGGFSKNIGLSDHARERALITLRTFAAEIRRHQVTSVCAVATSAVRDAVNGPDFVRQVQLETGIELEIIDGREEALLTLDGVVSGLGYRGNLLIFDIGGGSTEFTLVRDCLPLFTMSTPLGVVRLTEGQQSVAAMENKIGRELAALVAGIHHAGLEVVPGCTTLVGTAGTATTLASVDLELASFDYSRVHGYVMTLESVSRILGVLQPLTPDQRLAVPGVEKGREDLVVAGILTTIKTMELFGFDRFTVCETGLLDGLLMRMMRGQRS